MEQRMVTDSDDGEQLQQSKTKEAAMEQRIVAIVTAMARAEELKQVAELIRLEGGLSHDVKIVVGDEDGTPLL